MVRRLSAAVWASARDFSVMGLSLSVYLDDKVWNLPCVVEVGFRLSPRQGRNGKRIVEDISTNCTVVWS